jgi:hypothetical protein
MTSKLHIRVGSLEVDFEGTEEFLRDELSGIIATIAGTTKVAAPAVDVPVDIVTTSEAGSPIRNGLTTGSIAAKLQVTSGPELIVAAAGRLALFEGKDTYTRQQILHEMKTAGGYYKMTYRNNLSASLQRLVGDRKLVETAANTFALAPATKAELSSKLAE